MHDAQGDLFGAPPAPGPVLPEGLRYQEDFLSLEEEAALIGIIGQLPLEAMKYQAGPRGGSGSTASRRRRR